MSDVLITKQVIDEAKAILDIPEAYNETVYPFRPVKCLEEDIETLAPINNFLYFTTDSKKIYFGQNNEFLPMCASTGFYYGIKPMQYDNTGTLPDPNVIFNFEEIENDEIPEIDDLILNIGTDDFPDGCFYRVKEIMEDSIATVRLTLQGSGSMGPGGGDVVSSFTVARIGAKDNYFSSTDSVASISFKGFSTDEENYISHVWWVFNKDPDVPVGDEYDLTHPMGEPYIVDLLPHLSKFSTTGNTITVYAEDKYGTSRNLEYKISLVEMKLENLEAELLPALENNLSYNLKISGGQNLTTKYIECTIYDEYEDIVGDPQIFELNPSYIGNLPISINLTELPHGSYTLIVQAKGSIGASKVASNILRHKILRQVSGYGALFDAFLPEVIQQYNDIPISYLLVTDGVNDYSLEIQLGSNKPIITTITANELGSYTLASIDKQGIYTLLLTVPDLNIQKQYTFQVEKYSGTLPVIDTTRSDLQLYLTASGYNNDLVNRDQWESQAEATASANYIATLSNFYYGTVNGWSVDEDGVSYLKATQGAKVSLESYEPFATDPMSGLGMTIELDFKISGVTDFDAELIKCYSTNQFGTIVGGFAITGNQAKFYHSSKNTDDTCIKFNIVENKRIRLTYKIEPRSHESGFPMILSYLNGIISNAEAYKTTDTMRQSDNPALLEIDSTYGEVALYSVRFYNNAIDEATILNNYQASLPSKEARQAAYESNLILNSDGKIDLTLIEAEDYNLQIPYVKLTGGFGCDKKFKMKDFADDSFALPVGKKDYRLIDIEVYYPHTDYFAGYGELDAEGNPTYKFIEKCTFEDTSLNVTNGFGQTPITGAMMYCQGTSSMEYPVKNLRVKMKSKKINVRPDISGVELVCFKADYMDSSGSHNTGAANLIDALYESIHIATPGQEHFDDETIVTCIKGHPCIIFWSPTGEPGSYEFIGKYNLNLDKATPEPFGFKYSSEETDLEPTETLKEADIKYGYLLNEDGSIMISDGKKENAIYCYEFLDNKVKVCNFLPESGMTYYNTWYEDYYNEKEKKYMPGWTKGFESRYPEDRVGTNEADNLYELAKWINELQTIRVTEEQEGKTPSDVVYIYDYILSEEPFSDTTVYYEKVGEEYSKVQLVAETYEPGVYYTRTVKEWYFIMTSLERFKREYQTYFNKDFLVAYYVITETLHMMDSRVKNMMIATWGKEQRSYLDLDNNEHTVYRWIWYPIFYDMDTMLGLNNQGKPQWKYDDDDSNPLAYNGDDVLWNFVRDALYVEVNDYYDALEQSGGLTARNIIPKFNDNQGSMANEAMYNQDCKYKYLDPYRNRYFDYLNEIWIEPGTMQYLYAAQGSRDLDREYYVTNRILYLSGKHASTNYYLNKNNYITFRVNEPKVDAGANDEEKEKIRNTLIAVPISKSLDYTSLKTGYAGVLIGANGQLNNYRFEDEQTISVECDTEGAGNTEAYLLGVNILADLGDLSATYPEKFLIGGSIDCRLKRLQLGNNHRDYYNQAWSGVDPISFSTCTYLDEFEMSNCSEYKQPLDFSKNKVITKIYLTGNGTTSVQLPAGGIIQELRLPAMQSLRIDSHSLLTDEAFTFGYYDYSAENETYPEKGHWVNDFSNLTELQIINTPIDTYNIVCNAPQLGTYQLNGFNWQITENNNQDFYIYQGIANKIEPIEGVTYYYLNDNKEYEIYTGNFDDNKYLSILSSMITNGAIKEIPILEFLKNKNTIDDIDSSFALTGNIHINVEAAADEFELFYKYNESYPGVTITYGELVDLTEAYTIGFYHSNYISGMSPYASRLNNGKTTWKDLIVDLTTPSKSSDDYYHYTFSGVWEEVEGEGEFFNLTESDVTIGDTTYISNLNSNPPERDLKLVPVFIPSERLYKIIFCDDTGAEIPHLTTELTYDNKAQSLEERLSDKPLYFLYKEYTGDLEHGRYSLKGWISKEDYDNKTQNPTLINLKNKYVNSKELLQFYAYFGDPEDANLVATNIECFKSEYKSSMGLPDGTSYSGYSIEVKDAYADYLEGRITLPSFDNNNNPFIIIGGTFNTAKKITEIYFLDECSYKVTSSGSFSNCSALTAIYLPENFEGLHNSTFYNCINLTTITLSDSIKCIGDDCFYGNSASMKINLSALPANLIYLGTSAFWNCGDITITSLPVGLQTLSSFTFYNCKKVKIIEFGSIDASIPGASQLKCLDAGCFFNAGDGVTAITIYGSVSEIKSSGGDVPIFKNYGAGSLTDIYAAREATAYIVRFSSTAEEPVYSERLDWIDSRDIDNNDEEDVKWHKDVNLGG